MIQSETAAPTAPTRDAASGTIDASFSPRRIRRLAVRALLAELATFPKPGLVSLVDAGSHDDMDAATFVRSARALRGYFRDVAAAGRDGAPFSRLRDLGSAAEAHMVRATGGVNTHRGAIFALGLLASATGRPRRERTTLGDVVRIEWGDDLRAHRRATNGHGRAVFARHGIGGAVDEAAAGFPHLFAIVLPAYRAALSAGATANQARVQAFIASLATLPDTNLVHRGGVEGLHFAQRLAAQWLDRGGTRAADWRERALHLHRAFVEKRLSPGGSADLLACCLFVHAIEG